MEKIFANYIAYLKLLVANSRTRTASTNNKAECQATNSFLQQQQQYRCGQEQGSSTSISAFNILPFLLRSPSSALIGFSRIPSRLVPTYRSFDTHPPHNTARQLLRPQNPVFPLTPKRDFIPKAATVMEAFGGEIFTTAILS